MRHRGLVLAVALLAAGPAAPQALDLAPLPGGGRVITVTLPLADAVSVAWIGGDGEVHDRVAPAVAGLAALEATLRSGERVPAVVAVTGPLRPDEVRRLAGSVAGGRPVAPPPRREAPPLAEGGTERRLGPPGAAATVRLELPLPPAGDPLRPAAEVLAELLPSALGEALPPVRVRRGGERVVLELATEPELAGMHLDRLRLELGRIAASPPFEAEAVAATASALAAARTAELERHPDGARLLVRAWLAGGDAAVRQALYGFGAVDAGRVAEAARRWLAVHPGAAELRLPPRALNPRFATAPRLETLPGGTVVAVLERPTAALAAVCLRPALVPDPGGERTATVLARMAAALREGTPRPAVVRVEHDPPHLELEGPPDRYAELLEALAGALARVAGDTTPVPEPEDARGRALGLLAVLLGSATPGPLEPARLLAPANRVVGVVAPDAEAALEAAVKLLAVEEGAGPAGPTSAEIPVEPRRRVAVSGERSALAVALGGEGPPDDPALAVAAGLVASRLAEAGLPATLVSASTPGGAVPVLVVEGEGELPDLEAAVAAAWAEAVRPPEAAELEPVRRRVAAAEAVRWSGSAGRAALAAAVAAGERSWTAPERRAMEVLGVEPGAVSAHLARWRELGSLPTTGAGPLPVSSLPLPPGP